MKSTEVIQPSAMSAPIAHKGSKFDIPEAPTGTEQASVAEGFPDITMIAPIDGGLPPRGQDCNGMFYLSTDQKVFLQNGGILTFSQEVSDVIGGYPQGAILDYVGGNGSYTKVKSLIDDNTFNFVSTPSYIDGQHWELVDFGGANIDLSNLSDIGLDKINQSKALETGNVSSDKEVYADVLKYAHSTFDKSKFEIVGSPVVTDDGIASGFKPHNETRITFNDTFNVANKNFNFTFSGKLNGLPDQNLSANAPLLDIRDSVNNKWILIFQLKNGNIQMANSHYGGESIHSTVITPDDLNGDFKADLIVNNENIILNFYQNGDKKTIQFAYPNKLENVKIRLAYGLENAFPGSYDLKKCSLTIEGIPTFSGNVTGIDTIKPDDYTVVGTPTISDDGILTTPSDVNTYVDSVHSIQPIALSNSENFSIFCKLPKKTAASSYRILRFQQIGTTDINANFNLESRLDVGSSGVGYRLVYYESQNNSRSQKLLDFQIPEVLNQDVPIKVEYNSTQNLLRIYKYIDNQEILITSITLTAPLSYIDEYGYFYIGKTQGYSLDLNSYRIYSNGNLIYQPCLKIPYTLSKTGSKIVDAAYRDRVQDMYEQFGHAPYYTLDEENQDFTLPMGELYGFYEKYKNSINQLSDQRFQELLDLVYPIGRPVPEVNNYLAANEVWLEGAIVNIADYPLLYQKYGTKYGGDGVTTFGLIDARNKALFWGSPDGSVKYIGPGLPNIRGAFTFTGDSVARPINGAAREAFYLVQNTEHGPTLENTGNGDALKILEFAFNASQYNPIYQDALSGFVVPNSFQVRFKTRYK